MQCSSFIAATNRIGGDEDTWDGSSACLLRDVGLDVFSLLPHAIKLEYFDRSTGGTGICEGGFSLFAVGTVRFRKYNNWVLCYGVLDKGASTLGSGWC